MKLKELRSLKNISQAELGRIIGVERSTICQYEKGNRMPDNETLCKIADYFGVTVDYLLGREEKKYRSNLKYHVAQLFDSVDVTKPLNAENNGHAHEFPYSVQDYLLNDEEIKKDFAIKNEVDYSKMDLYPVPLLGRVVAGVPIESQENFEGYVYINHQPKEEYFALKVFGDSMINAGIPDGAILIVHKQSYADNGNIVVALLNGEQTVKYLKYMEDDIYLVPANNNYLPIPVRKNDDFLVLGKVVEIRINL